MMVQQMVVELCVINKKKKIKEYMCCTKKMGDYQMLVT